MFVNQFQTMYVWQGVCNLRSPLQKFYNPRRGNGIGRIYEIIVKNDTAEILMINCHDQCDSVHFWWCMIFLDGRTEKLAHISVLQLPERQYKKEGKQCHCRTVIIILQLISHNFSLNIVYFVPNFVVKFKSSYWNSQAGLQTKIKPLIGPGTKISQSNALFTNRLVNSSTQYLWKVMWNQLPNYSWGQSYKKLVKVNYS